MNRYLLYKELQDILDICGELGFDLYSWKVGTTEYKGRGIVFRERSSIIQKIRERNPQMIDDLINNDEDTPILSMWISRDGVCKRTCEEEICIRIGENRISYALSHTKSRNSPWVRHQKSISKEEIRGILKRWAEELKSE